MRRPLPQRYARGAGSSGTPRMPPLCEGSSSNYYPSMPIGVGGGAERTSEADYLGPLPSFRSGATPDSRERSDYFLEVYHQTLERYHQQSLEQLPSINESAFPNGDIAAAAGPPYDYGSSSIAPRTEFNSNHEPSAYPTSTSRAVDIYATFDPFAPSADPAIGHWRDPFAPPARQSEVHERMPQPKAPPLEGTNVEHQQPANNPASVFQPTFQNAVDGVYVQGGIRQPTLGHLAPCMSCHAEPAGSQVGPESCQALARGAGCSGGPLEPLGRAESREAMVEAIDGFWDRIQEHLDQVLDFLTSKYSSKFGMVNIISHDIQHHKSMINVSVESIPRCQSFCAWVIENKLLHKAANDTYLDPQNFRPSAEPPFMVIHDATKHPVFSKSQAVSGGPQVRFYAGVPITLRSSSGNNICLGTVCIMDDKPSYQDFDPTALLQAAASITKLLKPAGDLFRMMSPNDMVQKLRDQIALAETAAIEGGRKQEYQSSVAHRKAQKNNASASSSVPTRGRRRTTSDMKKSGYFDIVFDRIVVGIERRTTVMFSGIPNRFSPERVQLHFRECGVPMWDFFHVLGCSSKRINKGCGFMNFLAPRDVIKFFKIVQDKLWPKYGGDKLLHVSYARVQGPRKLATQFGVNQSIYDDKFELKIGNDVLDTFHAIPDVQRKDKKPVMRELTPEEAVDPLPPVGPPKSALRRQNSQDSIGGESTKSSRLKAKHLNADHWTTKGGNTRTPGKTVVKNQDQHQQQAPADDCTLRQASTSATAFRHARHAHTQASRGHDFNHELPRRASVRSYSAASRATSSMRPGIHNADSSNAYRSGGGHREPPANSSAHYYSGAGPRHFESFDSFDGPTALYESAGSAGLGRHAEDWLGFDMPFRMRGLNQYFNF